MVAITKPPFIKSKSRPDMALMMDFTNDDNSTEDVGQTSPSGYGSSPSDEQLEQKLIQDDTPRQQSFDMPEMNVDGKVNKLYDYDKELKLLKQYSGDISDQPEKDIASENSIRTALSNLAGAKLSDDQLDEIHRKEAEARLIGGIFGASPRVFFANGQQRSLGANPFPDLVRGWVENINAPLKKAEYKANEYQKEAANRKTLSDVERANLAARGKDLENFSGANKQILSTIDVKQKADPNSDVSKMARDIASRALQQARDNALLPPGIGGEKRQRYRELAPFYDTMNKAMVGASYDDVQRINKIIEAKEKEVGRRTGEDIRESGYQLQAARLGAMLGQGNPAANAAAAKTGEEVAEKQDALNTMLRVYELAQDPEVQKGFGTMTFGRIMEIARQGLSPKQAEFQQLLASANSETIKSKYGANFTGSEEKRANEFLPTPDNSIKTLLPRVSGMNQMAAKGLYNSFGKHYGLTTGRDFGRDFGIQYNPETRQFNPNDIEKMRNLSPWSMLPPRGLPGKGAGSSASITIKGGAEPVKKVLRDADIDQILQNPKYSGKTREQIIKEAREHNYVYQP